MAKLIIPSFIQKNLINFKQYTEKKVLNEEQKWASFKV